MENYKDGGWKPAKGQTNNAQDKECPVAKWDKIVSED